MSKIKKIDIDTGRNLIIYLNRNGHIFKKEGFKSLSRVKIFNDELTIYGILHIIDNDTFLTESEIGLSSSFFKKYKIKEGDIFMIKSVGLIPSFQYDLSKLNGFKYEEKGLNDIFKDIIEEKYDDIQIACFCSSTAGNSLDEKELLYLTKAMIKINKKIDWKKNIVVDLHCIGGIPGNRTSPASVAIIAEYGMFIPKTSTRSITSPSGTIDTMEVFTNIDISDEKIVDIVKETNGCLIWSGILSPIDEIVISVLKDLNLDGKGIMIASIISKKIAAGSSHILIDIPYGPQAKCKDLESAKSLKYDFETLGKNLGVHVYVYLSEGNQPIGNGIGPALEAKDILDILKNEPNVCNDLKEKILYLSGIIIEFDPNVKKGEGIKIAREILESGRAFERFKKICEAQGGYKEIPVAKYQKDIISEIEGKIIEINIKKISTLGKLCGCPSNKEAGIYLYKHLNDYIKKGEKIMTLYSNSMGELNTAYNFALNEQIFKIISM